MELHHLKQLYTGTHTHIQCIAQISLINDIPHGMIHELPQQLNRRLGPVHFPRWHVQIINEYDTPLAHRWPKDTFTPLVQLGHYDILPQINNLYISSS